jgi:hypothetical protein
MCLHIPPLSFTHLWLRCSNFFNTSKKNYFGCAQVGKYETGKAKDLSVPLRMWHWGRLSPGISVSRVNYNSTNSSAFINLRVVSFTPLPLYSRGKSPGTHLIGAWVGPRVVLDDVKKRKFLSLPELELRPLSCRARSQLLYRLSYPGTSLTFL